jgi:prepilin-type N-terminal cleavage/methylation domain-containing protein
MILDKIRAFYRSQSGYTFIEMVAVLAISGIIALGAMVANYQLINQTAKNNDYTAANRHVLNAIQWISHDAQMAQDVSGASGFPATSNLTLSWTTWDNETVQVVYSVANGQLRRNYTAGAGPTQQLLVSQYIDIDPASTNCTWANGELTITVTGSVGEGSRIATVTKEKTITSRPNL